MRGRSQWHASYCILSLPRMDISFTNKDLSLCVSSHTHTRSPGRKVVTMGLALFFHARHTWSQLQVSIYHLPKGGVHLRARPQGSWIMVSLFLAVRPHTHSGSWSVYWLLLKSWSHTCHIRLTILHPIQGGLATWLLEEKIGAGIEFSPERQQQRRQDLSSHMLAHTQLITRNAN